MRAERMGPRRYVSRWKSVTGGGSLPERPRPAKNAPAPTSRTTAPAASNGTRRVGGAMAVAPALIDDALWLEEPDKASSAIARSCAEWNRSFGSFSRQRLTIRSIDDGRFGLISANSGGTSFRIAFI